jgi:ankyrin repeat protein
MTRVRRSSRLSLPTALLVAGLCVAGGSLEVAAQEAPLADAVQHGDRTAMLALLAQQVDVNAAQGDGATALHWAVYRDEAETTAALIRAGADVNVPNHYGVTPLALASTNGNASIIEQLVRSGADPQDPRQALKAGDRPLLLPARSGQVAAVTGLRLAGVGLVGRTAFWPNPRTFSPCNAAT